MQVYYSKKLPETIPASLARSNFYTILEEVDSWEETVEILSNKKLMKTIRESAEDFRKGKIVTYEEFLNEA